jgi:hypothetical protein
MPLDLCPDNFGDRFPVWPRGRRKPMLPRRPAGSRSGFRVHWLGQSAPNVTEAPSKPAGNNLASAPRYF